MKSTVEQQDYQNDHGNQTETTTRVVAPAAAVRKNRRRAERKKHQDDKQDEHSVTSHTRKLSRRTETSLRH